MFRNEHWWNLIYFIASHMIKSLMKKETLLMFSGKEVDFARSLLDKQHDSGAPIENVVQNHLNIALLNIF